MGYLKTLTNKDVIITPFIVNKQFTSSGTTPTYNDGNIFTVRGENRPYPLSGGLEGSGSLSLVYNSIKQLYYGNYLEDGYDGLVSNAATASFNPDGTVTGPRYTTNYNNNIQSIDERRYFPTSSFNGLLGTTAGIISVTSIPSNKFGNFIKPGSLSFTFTHGVSYDNTIKDDGQGNLICQTNIHSWEVGDHVGNVIYESGIIVVVGPNDLPLSSNPAITNFTKDLSWESSVTIYETQYKCTMRASEFNYSTNPTLITSSSRGQNNILTSGSATYSDFVTGSIFSPFVTAVGLYNDNQELLAVGKLAQPLQTSQTTDTTILINIDK
jgi:hypothetical protein